jgi:hypothetical protein
MKLGDGIDFPSVAKAGLSMDAGCEVSQSFGDLLVGALEPLVGTPNFPVTAAAKSDPANRWRIFRAKE